MFPHAGKRLNIGPAFTPMAGLIKELVAEIAYLRDENARLMDKCGYKFDFGVGARRRGREKKCYKCGRAGHLERACCASDDRRFDQNWRAEGPNEHDSVATDEGYHADTSTVDTSLNIQAGEDVDSNGAVVSAFNDSECSSVVDKSVEPTEHCATDSESQINQEIDSNSDSLPDKSCEFEDRNEAPIALVKDVYDVKVKADVVGKKPAHQVTVSVEPKKESAFDAAMRKSWLSKRPAMADAAVNDSRLGQNYASLSNMRTRGHYARGEGTGDKSRWPDYSLLGRKATSTRQHT